MSAVHCLILSTICLAYSLKRGHWRSKDGGWRFYEACFFLAAALGLAYSVVRLAAG